MTDISRVELMELDIDLRLADLWREANKVLDGDWNVEIASAYMRAAYGRGYTDAFVAANPEEFFHENGYQVPSRRKS